MNDNDFIGGILITLLIFGIVEFGAWAEGYTRDDILYVHIAQAIEVCKDNGGLRKIEGESIGAHEFICHNGAVFTYKKQPKTVDE